ncbi:MAG: polymer-forming cytoskeletal protein [Acidobacteriota bacterium]|nr:polymer-forming cytoskeletal protein [Acidobacteriota bacterium]
MITLPDAIDSQRGGVLDQSPFEEPFAPDAHFGEWLQAVESFRNRGPATSLPGAYLEKGNLNFEDALSFYDHFEDKISSKGTLVVTEHGKLQADVEVTMAMIDGIFKGNITATEGVVLENHALVIGDIYTPELTIRGGAIIEGKVRFDERPQTSWERPRWEAFKVSFARVWRSRIFS